MTVFQHIIGKQGLPNFITSQQRCFTAGTGHPARGLFDQAERFGCWCQIIRLFKYLITESLRRISKLFFCALLLQLCHDIIAHAGQITCDSGPHTGELNDVIAKITQNWRRYCIQFHGINRIGKWFHHGSAFKPPQITTLGCRSGVGRILFGQCSKSFWMLL